MYSEIKELRSHYLVGQNEVIDDVTENVWSIFDNQLKFPKNYIVKDKPLFLSKTTTKIGSSSSPSSIWFPPQETIAERVNLIPQERKKSKDWNRNINSDKLWTRFPVLLAQTKTGNDLYKLENEIRQIST